jgi:hypothetical protein
MVARMLAFKLTIDTSKLPAVGDLVRSLAMLLLGGDRSAWDRALLMPHYAAAGMPLLSSLQVMVNRSVVLCMSCCCAACFVSCGAQLAMWLVCWRGQGAAEAAHAAAGMTLLSSLSYLLCA